MPTGLRLLIVEDSADDAALLLKHLERLGQAVAQARRVETLAEFEAALAADEWDAVLADHALPRFSAPAALAALQASGRDLPFIVISGVIDEESAVGSLRAGAHDFVTKANLARLGPALERELRAAAERRAHRQQEASFQLLFHNHPLPMWVYDLETLRILEVNHAAEARYGYTRAEFLNLTLRDLRPPEELPRLEANLAAQREREERSGPWLHRLKDGTLIEVEISSSATLFAGRPARLVLANDITERLRAERALWESEQKYRSLVETTEDVILMADMEGKQVYRNPAFFTSQGLDPNAPVSPDPFDRIHPDDIPRLKAVLAGIQAHGTYQYEYRLRHAAGHWMHRLARSTLLRDPNGQPAGVITIIRDITERKAAEDRIQRQVAYLTALREIDRAITSSLDLRLSLSLLLNHAVEQLRVDGAAALVFNPATQELQPAAEQGLRLRAADLPAPRLGRGPAGRAALERRLVHIPDLRRLDDDPRAAQIAAAGGFASQFAVPLIAKGEVRGVLELYRRAPGGAPDDEWLAFLHALAGQAAIAVDNAQLFSSLQRANTELGAAIDAALEGWARSLHLRDRASEGHSQRVAELMVLAGSALGLGEAELLHARRGALLHDIGKLALPDSLLLKPGPLDEAEWALVRQHPTAARDLLAPIAFLRPALDIPYCHHERWDGAGYPRGLKGDEIPIQARIFAVVNAWDALTSDRPYRAAWPPAQARAHLQAEAGRAFDPRAVRAVLNLV